MQDIEPIATAVPSSTGREPLGFVLESELRARRIRNGRSMLLALGNGAEVIDGDRLQIAVRTSQDAFLYLAFCSRQARDPRYAGLQIFPEVGALRVRAHQTTIAPDRAAEIVLDNHPGREALYLVLSRVELSAADAELAQVISAAGHGGTSAECGTATSGSATASNANRVWSGRSQPRKRRKAPAGPAAIEPDPVVEIQRGGDIVWNNGAAAGLDADADGIVVLRYGLTHIAAP